MAKGAEKESGPRSCGSAIISFGLVTVPVKLYTAVSSHDVAFNQLHDACGARLKQQSMTCTACGEVVEKANIVKGYEHAKNQYVRFTADELEKLEVVTENSVEIEEFVPVDAVDPIYFERTWHLGPDKGAQKAYKLLAAAMEAEGKAAVAKYSTRGKEKLALVRAGAGGLILHTLFYADEVRAADGIDHGEGFDLKDGELELAEQLIDGLASDTFDPDIYEDSYRAKLMAVIDQKVAGQDVIIAVPAKATAKVVDMMDALKASLAAAKEKKAAAALKPVKSGRKAA